MHPIFASCFPLSLGTAPFGTGIPRDTAFSILDTFTDLGGNLIDTAAVYGMGVSEQTLGEWMRLRGNRNLVLISTKGGHPSIPDWSKRITEDDIRADMEDSLRYLGTDRVDVYFLHRDDESVAVSVIMDELNRQAARGALNLLGASNWSVARIYQANDYCVKHGMRGFDVSQICFNLMRPSPKMLGDETLMSMNDEEEAIYRDMQMPIMAFTSQAAGFVSKFIDVPNAQNHSNYASEDNLRRLDRIRVLCRDTGLSPTAVTLGYLYGQALAVIPVTSVSNDRQLDDVIACSDTSLTPEQIAWIDGK